MIKKEFFGKTKSGETVDKYTMTDGGFSASVITFGATLQSLLVPAKNSVLDVVLGYDTVSGYEDNDGYLGATVGRNSNRIKDGKFTLNGKTYNLAINDKGKSNLHGGVKGFSYKVFSVDSFDENGNSVTFKVAAADGEENFPCNVTAQVTYTLSGGALTLDYYGEADGETVLSMTNHAYFTLDGDLADTAHENLLKVYSDFFTATDEYLVPTGEILTVKGTPMDFTEFKPINKDINAKNKYIDVMQGYDLNYCLKNRGEYALAATVKSLKSGISMDVLTDLPGVQLYTGAYLTERKGKNGRVYTPNISYCLETQTYPDGLNNPHFPSPLIKKGKPYKTRTTYKFTID